VSKPRLGILNGASFSASTAVLVIGDAMHLTPLPKFLQPWRCEASSRSGMRFLFLLLFFGLLKLVSPFALPV
jgi:hypothetical protein